MPMTDLFTRTRGLVGGPKPTWFPAQLVALHAETRTARTLIFDVPGWPGHQAGQHVDVRLTAADGYSAQRAYSISSPTDGDLVSLTVQKVAGGEVSPYLMEDMELGDELEIRGPIGAWFVWSPSTTAPVEQPVLLVGGGSGIAPLMAMVRERARLASKAPFRLVYSIREPEQVLYQRELAHTARDTDLDLDLVYTRRSPADGLRPVGRITDADLRLPTGWPAEPATRAYVCGPTGFVEHVIGLLLGLGFTNRSIRAERFGYPGD